MEKAHWITSESFVSLASAPSFEYYGDVTQKHTAQSHYSHDPIDTANFCVGTVPHTPTFME